MHVVIVPSSLIEYLGSNIASFLIKCSRFENHHGLLCTIGYVTAECMKDPSFVSF